MESGFAETDVWRMCLCWPEVWKLIAILAIVSEWELAKRGWMRLWHQAKLSLLMMLRMKRRACLADGTDEEEKTEEEEEEKRVAEKISMAVQDWKKEEKVPEEDSKDVQTEERDEREVPAPEKLQTTLMKQAS